MPGAFPRYYLLRDEAELANAVQMDTMGGGRREERGSEPEGAGAGGGKVPHRERAVRELDSMRSLPSRTTIAPLAMWLRATGQIR